MLSLFASGMMVGACGGSESGDVESASADPGSRVTLEPILTIGCADCDDERQITPTAVALLSGDRIAVLDSWEPFVRIFDGTGKPVGAFGDRGQGPGELGIDGGGRWIPGTWILEIGANIGVVDVLPPTLEVFGANGAVLDQTLLELPAIPADQAWDATTNTLYRMGTDPMSPDRVPAISACELKQTTISSCRVVTPVQIFLDAEAPDGPRARGPGVLAIAAAPNGQVVVAGLRTYRLWRLDATGNVIGETRRYIERVAKTPEDIEYERALPGVRADAEMDPLHPHVEANGLDADGAGRVWALTGRWTATQSTFDVFNIEGEYVGAVTADARIRRGSWAVAPFFADGDRLAGITRSADGSEQVRVWRITTPDGDGNE